MYFYALVRDAKMEERKNKEAERVWEKNNLLGLPCGPMVKTPHSQCRGAQVQFLVRELRFHTASQK